MAHWLYKSEPDVFSYDDLAAKGEAGQEWDGVRNYQARNHMRAMKRGDRGFFYHSNEGKAIVGLVEVVREVHPDSTDDSGTWECVDIRAVRPVARPLTLAEAKAEPRLQGMALVSNSRLSVQPVTDAEWAIVCELTGVDP
ncbi:EVE domain-containing protein [Kaistia geumhonensis]|uniref:RNA-binding protein with PUA-like domain n=1 Tax=Kaistia geumhonensis TaxID=410839 RepID=A0ABU0M836_9HYPH|nr:EVE domain-containing protein [Kaistia geumhonensis]MCX5477669.1 EVE domain-containing protein [Kaistia geumhonensis]MDQ0517122.1 putative RNA-binding protein with PUA-like domain [Kaistia geumhonensis]